MAGGALRTTADISSARGVTLGNGLALTDAACHASGPCVAVGLAADGDGTNIRAYATSGPP